MHFKRNLLSAALASAIALTATGVSAQTAETATGQTPATDATDLDTVVRQERARTDAARPRVFDAFERLSKAWRALRVGEALTLDWPSGQPIG